MPTALISVLLPHIRGKPYYSMVVPRTIKRPPLPIIATVTNRSSYSRIAVGGMMCPLKRNGVEKLWVGWRHVSSAWFCGDSMEKNVKTVLSRRNSGGRLTAAADMGKDKEEEEEEVEHQSTNLITLPTILTLGRVAAVPLLIGTFYMNGSWATATTTSIFIAASVTDWLDGYIARKMRLGSTFGAFLDPVADKLMVATTLVLLCTRPLEVGLYGHAPWLLTVPAIAIIGREITMSAVREWAASQNTRVLEAVAVNNWGKWKTATQMTALTILLATRDSSLTGLDNLVISGVVLLYVSAGLAVWSLAVYMKRIWRIMLN